MFYWKCKSYFVFSSPELKAPVSFSDHLSSIVCLSVRLSVHFSHFHLLLLNHKANFSQTWHKASFGKGDSSFFKWSTIPFSKYPFPNSENPSIKFINLLQNHLACFNQIWHKAFLDEGDSSLFKSRASLYFPREDNYEIAKIHWRNENFFSPEPSCQFQLNLTQSIS